MKILNKKSILFLAAVFAFFALVFKGSVYSQTAANLPVREQIKNNQQLRSQVASQTAERKEFAAQRLDAVKLKVCQRLSETIVKRSTKLTERAENMEKVFDRHAGAVEKYYLEKLVPKGQVLPNYNALLADIQAKKDVITPLLDKAKTDAAAFSCTGDNPKAQLDTFRDDMQAVIKALHAYRTSIKNLIVAVATLKGDNDNKSATGSARSLRSLPPKPVPAGTTQGGI